MSPSQSAVVWTAPGVVEVAEVPAPGPSSGWVTVRATRVGICGSDLAILHGDHARAQPGIVLGHEFAGEIADAGESSFSPGERVAVRPLIACADYADGALCSACRRGEAHVCARLGLYGVDEPGGLAELVSVRASSVHRVPSETPEGLEGLTEPLAVAVHAVSRSGLHSGDRVAVFGGGPIGLLVALVARERGAGDIVLVEPNPWRRSVAERFGFDTASDAPVDAIRDRTGGDGADIVFDSAGHPAVAAAVTAAARISGTIVIVGVYKAPAPIDLRTVNFAEQSIIGTRVYAEADFAEAVGLLSADALGLSELPTLTFPAAEAAAAFEAAGRGEQAMKVFIDPTTFGPGRAASEQAEAAR